MAFIYTHSAARRFSSRKEVSQVSSLHIKKKSLAFPEFFYVSFIISTNTDEKHENEKLMCKIKEILALRPC